MNNNEFIDTLLKYFEYTLRIGRYKDLNQTVFQNEKGYLRLIAFCKIVIFFVIGFFAYEGKVDIVLTETFLLLWLQIITTVQFALFLKGEDKKDDGKKKSF